MKHLIKFNESFDSNKGKKLSEVIGEIKSSKKYGWQTIYETTEGCIIMDKSILDDKISNISKYSSSSMPENCGEIILDGYHYYAYFENDKLRVIASPNGDDRGSTIFGDVFIVSGHDGNYLFNTKTGEFQNNGW
jgi:hypothetical protein